ncbi:MAG: molybdopterin-dependent oxidoreductase, partial [Candidatus Rokubacteria bacterium]|nr:molybdopterin-dependent oxidoreductase [Candidatus Rokubacteria bacterium]
LLGIGLACYVEICGFDDEETSDVVVGEDGRVTVLTGSASHGQGHETSYAQLVADELQVPIERVTVVHGDTERVRSGVGTYGSRSIARGGMHALGNARKVREKAIEIAATLLEAAPADLVLDDGRFTVRGVPDRSVSWTEVAAAGQGRLASRQDLKGSGTLFPFGAHLAVVEVDRETGRVRLLRYVSVDDSGFLVNPLLAQGQVHGGLAQGIGQALLEAAAFDASGQLLTSTLLDYALPKSNDLPSFETDHTRTLSPRTTALEEDVVHLRRATALAADVMGGEAGHPIDRPRAQTLPPGRALERQLALDEDPDLGLDALVATGGAAGRERDERVELGREGPPGEDQLDSGERPEENDGRPRAELPGIPERRPPQPEPRFAPLEDGRPRIHHHPEIAHQRRDAREADPPHDPDRGGRNVPRRVLVAGQARHHDQQE